MLAACTSSSLALLDALTLKRAPTSIGPDSIRSLKSPTAVTWSQDNSYLFVAQANGIHKFEPAGHHAGLVHETTHPIITIATRDKGNSILFNNETEIAVFETQSGTIIQRFNSHKTNITSLSLSNDTTLLASTSLNTVLIHNLTMASHTVLRGLPFGDITTCVFHTHTRTRLLIGIGNQLAIYDTSRPSSPAKVISMQKVGGSPIVAIACSPFSKTLIAVACSGGSIGLVDLDKEKGLFRTLSLRTPLSSVSFSPEGASIYAGTENGKILILDLRTLDKPPKIITVSQAGERIVCVAVQRKLKPGETTAKPSLVKPLSQQDVNKTPARRGPAAPSMEKRTLVAKPTKPSIAVTPPRSRVTSAASTPAKPRSTSATTLTSTPKPAIRMRTISTTGISSPATRSVSTPARPSTAVGRIGTARKTSKTSDAGKDENIKPNDKLDIPVSINDLLDLPGKRKENVAPKVDSGLGRIRKTSMTSRISSGQSTRPCTISTTSRTSTSSRTVSGTSASALSSTTARTSPSLKNKHSYEAVSPIPPVPKLPAAFHEEQLTSIRFSSSRTPSPDDLSLPENIPITPLPKRKDKGKGKEVISGMNLLGLGTPEVRRWVEAGNEEKSNGRKVGFAEFEGPLASGSGSSLDSNAETGETETHFQEAKIELTVQISPQRPLPQAKATSSWAAVPSPLRGTNASSVNDANDPTGAAHSGPSINNPAHDLLQSLVKDALYDFRRETKAEIIGLHLDLVRMGRGWRKEMREAMEEWSKELNEVREENKRLRHENDRLKRGY